MFWNLGLIEVVIVKWRGMGNEQTQTFCDCDDSFSCEFPLLVFPFLRVSRLSTGVVGRAQEKCANVGWMQLQRCA